jgi:hypothetical protein
MSCPVCREVVFQPNQDIPVWRCDQCQVTVRISVSKMLAERRKQDFKPAPGRLVIPDPPPVSSPRAKGAHRG